MPVDPSRSAVSRRLARAAAVTTLAAVGLASLPVPAQAAADQTERRRTASVTELCTGDANATIQIKVSYGGRLDGMRAAAILRRGPQDATWTPGFTARYRSEGRRGGFTIDFERETGRRGYDKIALTTAWDDPTTYKVRARGEGGLRCRADLDVAP